MPATTGSRVLIVTARARGIITDTGMTTGMTTGTVTVSGTVILSASPTDIGAASGKEPVAACVVPKSITPNGGIRGNGSLRIVGPAAVAVWWQEDRW